MNMSSKHFVTMSLLFALTLTITDSRSTRPRRKRCREPETIPLPSNSRFNLRSTFFRPTNLEGFNFTTVPQQYKKINIYAISKVQTYPKDPINESQTVIPGRDLCPVFYVLNSDENRIPNFFIEAVCSCKTPPSSYAPPSIIDCEQTIVYGKVQRRTGCKKGAYVYSEMWEPIRMGCSARSAPIRIINESPKSIL